MSCFPSVLISSLFPQAATSCAALGNRSHKPRYHIKAHSSPTNHSKNMTYKPNISSNSTQQVRLTSILPVLKLTYLLANKAQAITTIIVLHHTPQHPIESLSLLLHHRTHNPRPRLPPLHSPKNPTNTTLYTTNYRPTIHPPTPYPHHVLPPHKSNPPSHPFKYLRLHHHHHHLFLPLLPRRPPRLPLRHLPRPISTLLRVSGNFPGAGVGLDGGV